MAEQITHKRPLRIKVDKERRKQLHDFYKLKDSTEDGQDVAAQANLEHDSQAEDNSTSSFEEKRLEPSVPKISESRLVELVHAHNTLSSKKAEMNNTIKNTIYENYYDLIKVNELLHSVGNNDSGHLGQLKEVFKLLEER
ncbi:LAME_0H03598g1_1 [Lachancea meyersii CBS 8951]|uniref:LAME_0H03598g1_1 n=1 Tax=Lachancea meyersii CBS 8951 TaxID=1266667 RepID=A0A1G4KDS6_9SACH|nr:LAME_0H03598g1_1 [Lachancea meyersii CBS 8951]